VRCPQNSPYGWTRCTYEIQITQALDEDTAYYDQDTLDKYADYLEEKGRLIVIGNLLFDAETMAVPFVCDTRLCVPSNGAKDTKGKTANPPPAAFPTPRASRPPNASASTAFSPPCARAFPPSGPAIDKKKGYYYWDEDYDRYVAKKKKEFCVFLTTTPKNSVSTAALLHAYALEHNLSPALYKPSACTMFPVFHA